MFDMVPFRRKNELRSMFDDWFDTFFREELDFPVTSKTFRADLKETDKEYVVEAELPGFKKDDIEIRVKDNVLTIKAVKDQEVKEEDKNYIRRERRSGSVIRSFAFDNIKQDKVKAKYKNGILMINLPKEKQEVADQYKIEIE
ncbi:MAG: Hsp20/alpha crystallin family protein [Clostridia bacterium]|nr:Hsp20/alpha crystallin family protein [Clostridia bacterium]